MEYKSEGAVSEVYFQNNTDYVKSNFLIGAKYKSSLLENKVMAISLNKIKDAEEDKEGGLQAPRQPFQDPAQSPSPPGILCRARQI